MIRNAHFFIFFRNNQSFTKEPQNQKERIWHLLLFLVSLLFTNAFWVSNILSSLPYHPGSNCSILPVQISWVNVKKIKTENSYIWSTWSKPNNINKIKYEENGGKNFKNPKTILVGFFFVNGNVPALSCIWKLTSQGDLPKRQDAMQFSG